MIPMWLKIKSLRKNRKVVTVWIPLLFLWLLLLSVFIVMIPIWFLVSYVLRQKGYGWIGFAIIPETQVHNVKEYLDDIGQLLIMTVNPGFYGSQFLPETIHKISEVRKIKPCFDIEVDGGITPETIMLVQYAGANMFVSGSYIINSDDSKQAIDMLRNLIQ